MCSLWCKIQHPGNAADDGSVKESCLMHKCTTAQNLASSLHTGGKPRHASTAATEALYCDQSVARACCRTAATPWMQLQGSLPSTELVTLQCPNGSIWAGIEFASFYGGFDHFQVRTCSCLHLLLACPAAFLKQIAGAKPWWLRFWP